MTNALHTLSVSELAQGLRDKSYSAVELAEHFLARIKAHDGHINALITCTENEALDDARRADAALAAGTAGALTGIPLVHKDIFLTEGVRTTCASRMLDNFVAPFDATVVAKLVGPRVAVKAFPPEPRDEAVREFDGTCAAATAAEGLED